MRKDNILYKIIGIIKRDFSFNRDHTLKTFLVDSGTVIIISGILALLTLVSSKIMAKLSPVLSVTDPSAIQDSSSILAKIILGSVGSLIISLGLIFIVYSITRHLIWTKLHTMRFSMKGWKKTSLGILSFMLLEVIIISFPVLLAVLFLQTGNIPSFVGVLFWLSILLIYHFSLNYIYQLTKTQKVFYSYVLAFRMGFGKFLSFLPLYLVLLLVFLMISFIPWFLLHANKIIVSIASWTVLLVTGALVRSGVHQHIKEEENKEKEKKRKEAHNSHEKNKETGNKRKKDENKKINNKRINKKSTRKESGKSGKRNR